MSARSRHRAVLFSPLALVALSSCLALPPPHAPAPSKIASEIATTAVTARSTLVAAHVDLPSLANERVVIKSAAHAAPVSFRLAGAATGAEVSMRVRDDGVEDFVRFAVRPPHESLDYLVDVPRGHGLRLVANTLEVLDANGTPQFHVTPPRVTDLNGDHPALLSIADCSFDTDPRGPWGRPIRPPRRDTCTMHVSWSGVQYPAVVDPQWSTTGTMTVVRQAATLTTIPFGALAGKVLFAGGYGTALMPLATAELFDPATKTFAATGTMTAPRAAPLSVALDAGANGKILVFDSNAEVYDSATGKFTAVTGSFAPVQSPTFGILIPAGPHKGKVLIGGGEAPGDGGFAYSQAETALYDPALGSFSSGPALAVPRYRPIVTAITAGPRAGALVVASGVDASTNTQLPSLEIYDPKAGSFALSTAKFPSALFSGNAAPITYGKLAGKILFLEELSAELFDPVAQTFTPTNGPAVDRLQAMFVPVSTASDEELMMLIWGSLKNMGGLPPVISSDVELFDPNVPTFRTPPEKLPSGLNSIAQIGKQRAVALLPNGTDVRVVATGFVAGTSTPQPAVYYSTSANGVSCTSGTTCASSFCVDGVCCDQGCAEQCQACDVKGSVGKCAPVIGTPHGIRQKCVEGTDPICGKNACDGITTAACTFTPPRTSCGKECKNALFIPHGCDGAGKCISDLPGQCPGGFACADATSCATTCAVDTDCAIGFACFGGKCENGAVCMDDHTVQTVQGHQTCEPYQCRADDAGANATCLLMCQSVSDCVAPNICDLSGACVPPPIATTAGCSVEPGDSHCEGRVPFAVVALALALTISRRNARRSVTASQKPAG